jgi:hypothetical protein
VVKSGVFRKKYLLSSLLGSHYTGGSWFDFIVSPRASLMNHGGNSLKKLFRKMRDGIKGKLF